MKHLLLGLSLIPLIVFAADPPLPQGLMAGEPAGKSSQPPLPMGLGQSTLEEKSKTPSRHWKDYFPMRINGFVEGRIGSRIKRDPDEKQLSIAETRLHVDASKTADKITASIIADFVCDAIEDKHSLDLETGQGWLDLREANILYRASSFMDVKLGRQILTWGTGDLLFLNDMFSKDWNSFFIGRDEEYLKAPSDAVKIALYSDIVNVDLVYTPRFDSDRYIDGRRISYFNNSLDRLAGDNNPLPVETKSEWFSDDEIALRLHRLIQSYEVALYFYSGYWKSPGGQNSSTNQYTFPRLSVGGASARGPLGKGIANIEGAYYYSADDAAGDNPLINNSEYRLLLGYEQEIFPEFTVALQYYIEILTNYGAYLGNLPSGAHARDEFRQVFTLRLTKLALNQNLTLSFFGFFGINDSDFYLRPIVSYKATDNWTVSAGANVFYGKEQYTFFGQFENNSNVYCSVRYGF